MFDTAPPPAIAAAALAGVRLARADDAARERLAKHVRRTHAALAALGYVVPDGPGSHVVPVIFGTSRDALAAQAALLNGGVLAPAIRRPPTVAPGTSRIRISLTAAHRDGDLDALFAGLERCRTLFAIS